MGFDLNAKDRSLGEKGYFRASVYQMIFLRTSMVAAGVDEKLVYRKFAGNDGLFVTSVQSRRIAESLIAWLKHRNLILDLSEQNERAKISNDAYFRVFLQIGTREDKAAARHFSKSKSLPFRLDSRARKVVREFADFCRRSGGFWVG